MLSPLGADRHHAGYDRLLADIEMAETADQPHAVKLARPLFKAPDQKHIAIQ